MPVIGTTVKDMIMDAAMDLFFDNGVYQTSVRAIARAAGMAQSSLYNHFPTKDSLVLAVMVRSFETVSLPVESVFCPGRPPSLPMLEEALRVHAVQHMLVTREAMLFDISSRHMPAAVREHLHQLRKSYEERFQSLATVLAERGEITRDHLRIKIRILLTAGIEIGKWFKPAGQMSPRDIGEVYVNLCRSALCPE